MQLGGTDTVSDEIRASPPSGEASGSGEKRHFWGLRHLPRLHPEPAQGPPVVYEAGDYQGKHPRLHKLAVKFASPDQAYKRRHQKALQVLGSTGWVFKGIVYAIIGGLSCQSAVGDDEDLASASPQGAFVLVGSNTIGPELLVVVAIGVGVYAAWRFWEAIVGQGTDAANSNLKNFFRYRLSPFVSGCVYTAYAYFVCTLVRKSREQIYNADRDSTFNNWKDTTAGMVGLCLFGIAFVIATLVQLIDCFSASFYPTLRADLPRWFWWIVAISGHLGILARGAVFLFVAVLFFRTMRTDVGEGRTTVGDALQQLESSRGGKAVLFILGLGLIVYGLFAVLCGLYARVFPTPPPSGQKHVPVNRHTPRPAEEAQPSTTTTDDAVPVIPASAIVIEMPQLANGNAGSELPSANAPPGQGHTALK